MVQLVGLVCVYAKLRFGRESEEEDLRKSGAGVWRPRVCRTGHGRNVLPLEPALSRYGARSVSRSDDTRVPATTPRIIIIVITATAFIPFTVSPPAIKEPGWSGWGPWGKCSAKCGGGVRQRSRYCNNPPPQEGQDCNGCSEEYELCNQKPCVDSGKKVSSWTPWVAACNGTYKRYRFSCRTQPDQSAINIVQDKEENRLCQDGSCRRLGKRFVSSLLSLSITRVRFYTKNVRLIDVQRSRLDQSSDTEDASWSEWSPWSACSSDCGGGVQTKTRTCDGPAENCDGPSRLTRSCNTHKCKGIYLLFFRSTTGAVPACDRLPPTGNEIGTFVSPVENPFGRRAVSRLRIYPLFATFTGAIIAGVWSCWTDFGECSVTCGEGVRKRTRNCTLADDGCEGPSESLEPCYVPCQNVDAGWESWSDWSACDHQHNRRQRTRRCTLERCLGPDVESVPCFETNRIGKRGRSLRRRSF